MVGLWVPIYNGSCWGNGILASNGGWVERLGGHHGHVTTPGVGRGSNNNIIDTIRSAKI